MKKTRRSRILLCLPLTAEGKKVVNHGVVKSQGGGATYTLFVNL